MDLPVEEESMLSPNSFTDANDSSVSSNVSHKKKIRKLSKVDEKKMEVLNLARNVLEKPDEDEYMVAGKRIGFQLKDLEPNQRIIAEKLISDVIFYGKTKKLTEDSRIECNNKINWQPIPIDNNPVNDQSQFQVPQNISNIRDFYNSYSSQ